MTILNCLSKSVLILFVIAFNVLAKFKILPSTHVLTYFAQTSKANYTIIVYTSLSMTIYKTKTF